MPNKMTDEEIIKAWEWCEMFTDNIVLSNKKGEKFTFALQSLQTIKQVLKDYNRQKAEIERLRTSNDVLIMAKELCKGWEERAKAEAVKEFAERLKGEMLGKYCMYFNYEITNVIIDKLLKEMVGENE